MLLAQMAAREAVNDTMRVVYSTSQLQPYPFRPTGVTCRITRLWVASLGFSLSATIMAMLCKAWASEYLLGMSFDSPQASDGSEARLKKQAGLRQFRFNGLKTWRVGHIIAVLPLLLHLALLLFSIGLIDYLWTIDLISAIILTSITVATCLVYGATTILPSFITSCAYRTPLSHYISRTICAIRLPFRALVQFIWDRQGWKRTLDEDLNKLLHAESALWEDERKAVRKREADLIEQGMEWLRASTRDTRTCEAADGELDVLRAVNTRRSKSFPSILRRMRFGSKPRGSAL